MRLVMENKIGKCIVNTAVEIHREIGPNAHKKQLLTYLRLTGLKLGFLLNFSEALMKNGITRTVNGLEE